MAMERELLYKQVCVANGIKVPKELISPEGKKAKADNKQEKLFGSGSLSCCKNMPGKETPALRSDTIMPKYQYGEWMPF